MTEQRKPIFGFLWAKPDPDAPVDDAFRQSRRVRVTPRGPIRVLVLVVATLVVAVGAGSAVLAGLSTRSILGSFIAAAIVGGLLILVLRGWVVGTYVTDDAITIERTFVKSSIPWSEVASIEEVEDRCRFLGLPLMASGRTVIVVLSDGDRHATHLYTTSPDLWLRPEAFDMAVLRLQRWLP